jgi:hypothetical protein
MLKQLARLTVEADGRFATAKELQFLTNYLESAEQRISAYEKIRDNAETIIDRMKNKRHPRNNQNLFMMGRNDKTDICLRDMVGVLRLAATALLLNDLDRLRDNLLLWYLTIVNSFEYQEYTKINYQILEEIVNDFLTVSEKTVASPFFKLNYTILR